MQSLVGGGRGSAPQPSSGPATCSRAPRPPRSWGPPWPGLEHSPCPRGRGWDAQGHRGRRDRSEAASVTRPATRELENRPAGAGALLEQGRLFFFLFKIYLSKIGSQKTRITQGLFFIFFFKFFLEGPKDKRETPCHVAGTGEKSGTKLKNLH